jgi:hypothetical protein
MRKVGKKRKKVNPDGKEDLGNLILSDYFNMVFDIFSNAKLDFLDKLELAGSAVELSGSSHDLRDILLPSLAHLKVDKSACPIGLKIWYSDAEGLGSMIPQPPFEDFNGVGFSEKAEEEGYHIYYQPAFRQVFLYSEEKSLGIYWTQTTGTIPWWEPTFSFRIIFHWWTKHQPLQLMHAGALAMDKEGGWLIAGPSGSGKSSTCLTLLQHGVYYLGDDYVLVRLGENPQVYTLYQTAKLEPDNLEDRFGEFLDLVENKASYQGEKAIFQIYRYFPESFIRSVPLKGILLPKVNDTVASHIRPVSPGRAILGIAPTTLRHLPHDRENSYQKMKELSMRIPVLEWSLGTDKERLVESFFQLNSNER